MPLNRIFVYALSFGLLFGGSMTNIITNFFELFSKKDAYTRELEAAHGLIAEYRAQGIELADVLVMPTAPNYLPYACFIAFYAITLVISYVVLVSLGLKVRERQEEIDAQQRLNVMMIEMIGPEGMRRLIDEVCHDYEEAIAAAKQPVDK